MPFQKCYYGLTLVIPRYCDVCIRSDSPHIIVYGPHLILCFIQNEGHRGRTEDTLTIITHIPEFHVTISIPVSQDMYNVSKNLYETSIS